MSFHGDAVVGELAIGTIFIVWGNWIVSQIFIRHYDSMNSDVTFTLVATYTPSGLGAARWTVETFIKSLMLLYLPYDIHNRFTNGDPTEYGKLYYPVLFFFLPVVIDILLHYRIVLPYGSGNCSLALTFSFMGFVIQNQLVGTPGLAVTLLAWCHYGAAVTMVLELSFPRVPVIPLFRALCLALIGTWMCQIAFIVRRSQHWASDEYQNILAASIFTWHVELVIIVFFVIGSGIRYVKNGGDHCRNQDESDDYIMLLDSPY